jgi:para-aminobenzoate synthetase/4-amino-4-deoxychorismate lyase
MLLRGGECRERVLHPEDLARAEAIYCGNSVRGLVRVDLVDSRASAGSARHASPSPD